MIEEAAETWNNAGSFFRLYYHGVRASGPRIYLDSCLPDTVLARVLLPSSSGPIWGFSLSIVLNANINWNVTGEPDFDEIDLQSVVLHEFGHWLSLDDLRLPGDSDEVMYYKLDYGETKRVLGGGDISGIWDIYGYEDPDWPIQPPFITRIKIMSDSQKIRIYWRRVENADGYKVYLAGGPDIIIGSILYALSLIHI